MLTCKEATRMMSEGMDRQLAPTEQLQLRLHLALCRGCRAFRQQMDFLRQATRAYRSRGDGDGEP